MARNEEASGKKNIEAQTWDDLHVYTITCLEEGSGMFAVMVGNQITEQTIDQWVSIARYTLSNKHRILIRQLQLHFINVKRIFYGRNPMRDHVETEVNCVLPHKLTLLATGAKDSIAIHPKSGKVGV